VQNSSLSSPTSNSIVAKLLEVDADLAATEVQLAAQLQSIQEKRHSLKNVISLFPPGDTAASTPVETSTPELVHL
jgi:outer membrane protein TolC